MPLDADGEPGVDYLDRLHTAIISKPDGPDRPTELVDPLVMMATPLSLGAENGGDRAAWHRTTRLGLVWPRVSR